MATEAILIFDVGKTNKKLLLFDKHYRLLEEHSVHLEESVDEDNFPCEDVGKLTQWIEHSFKKTIARTDIAVKAVNFSGYGASFVCVDEHLKPVLVLSNYLKPYPTNLQDQFYERWGGKSQFSKVCASPPLGSLNSGLQLYRLREEKPADFKKVRWALHLPQYLSTILTGKVYSEMTSIGCHTSLWDFSKQRYHEWISEQQIDSILPPIVQGDWVETVNIATQSISIGVGLHDSSAALIPYLITFREPFILLSTGTWNISLNPFNQIPLSEEELNRDCLCYFNFEGKPVKASRLFAGHEHDLKVKELVKKYDLNESDLLALRLNASGDLSSETPAAIAYLAFMKDLVVRQAQAVELVRGTEKINRIFIDGGFTKNLLFMQLLKQRFWDTSIYAASVPQASALGAALAIHHHWNSEPIPKHLIELRKVNVNLPM